jgi:DNA-directed RNA polymerase subunit beta
MVLNVLLYRNFTALLAYFSDKALHANGTKLYSARIIPFKGSWMEFATDINNVMYAYIDRKKKLPVTTLLRAIGYEGDKDILGDI